jgi:hypothetical protein
MAVYSSQRDGQQYRCIEVTRRFKVFDMVTITCKDGREINGEIIYIDKGSLQISGPYLPIEEIKLKSIFDINKWEPPESWK